MNKKQKRWLWVVIVLAVIATLVVTAIKWLFPVAVIVYLKELFV
jgi:cytochrome c-type biogenesis protein CcmE